MSSTTLHTPQRCTDADDLRVFGRLVEEQQAKKGQTLEDGDAPEVPVPGSELISIARRDRGNDDGQIDGEIGQHDCNMSPLVGEEFWQGKCSHLPMVRTWMMRAGFRGQGTYLDIGTTESRDGEARGDLAGIFGRCHHNVSDKRYLQESVPSLSGRRREGRG